MLYKPSLGDFSRVFLIGGSIQVIIFAAYWLYDAVCDQDEQIAELFSRLEDCEEKNKLEK